MLKISELNFGFNDAENYRRKENKQLLNQFFIRTESLDHIIHGNSFFLMGEKGTGKTAYAVYVCNNNYGETVGTLSYIRETEFQKFISMKTDRHLGLSDYTNIWKVILCLILSEKIHQRETNFISKAFPKFRNLKDAIDEFYANAFSPEIIHSMQFVEESKTAAELLSKFARAGGEEKIQVTFTESRFQTNLLYIQKKFEDALSSLKLNMNQILFIDGIDIRPLGIPYDDYLECIKGLANAVWSLNNDFFAGIKDSKGRLKVVLLIRPDIFNSLGLQNQNNKIRDNSVMLDWRTTYKEYRSSDLFKVADQLLSSQQGEALPEGAAWDHYFPFQISNFPDDEKSDPSFIDFLRKSYYRPRDIVSMLNFLQEHALRRNKNLENFDKSDLDSADYRRDCSDYLLGEIKDALSFYYTNQNYELFLKFFEYLDGRKSFDYRDYEKAWAKFINFIQANRTEPLPGFFETQDTFLQFLYELNVISYIEDAAFEQFHRWCFRERSLGNFSPKVKTHERYSIHPGLTKALNTGSSIFRRKKK
jgi:hypothetical protein